MKGLNMGLCLIIICVASAMSRDGAQIKDPLPRLKSPVPAALAIPPVERFEMANGIKLHFVRDMSTPTVSLRFLVKGGTAYDPVEKTGLSHVTAELMRIGGAGALDGKTCDVWLKETGASLTITAESDYFTISYTGLAENLPETLLRIADMLCRPSLPREKFLEIMERLQVDISRQNDQPSVIADREFKSLLYGRRTPYGAVLDYDNLAAITLKDVQKLYRTTFTPDNLLIGVSGAVEFAQLRDLLEKTLATWQGRSDLPPRPENPRVKIFPARVYLADQAGLEQVQLRIGHLGEAFNIDEFVRIQLFNQILESRLLAKFRTQLGLAHNISAGFYPNPLYPGLFQISTYTQNDSMLPVIRIILAEIDELMNRAPSGSELGLAKKYFRNAHILSLRSPGQILEREFYGIDEARHMRLLEDMEKVTTGELLELAKRTLFPNKMVIWMLGDRQKLADQLEKLGELNTVDIAIKPPPPKIGPPQASVQSLADGQEIMARLLMGPYRGYKTIKSIRSQGQRTVFNFDKQVNFSVASVQLFPDKTYTKLTEMETATEIEYVVNGSAGFMRQGEARVDIDPQEIQQGRFADFWDLQHQPQRYLFIAGGEIKEGELVYQELFVVDKTDGEWVRFLINKKSGFLEIEEMPSSTPGINGMLRTVRSNIRLVKGIPFAFQSQAMIGERRIMLFAYTAIEVDVKVDERIFSLENK